MVGKGLLYFLQCFLIIHNISHFLKGTYLLGNVTNFLSSREMTLCAQLPSAETQVFLDITLNMYSLLRMKFFHP